MLRRRIFSSAMASVMALTSVAVVAQAEDAQYKSKADLEKLVNETYGENFRNTQLGDYGTISAENVLAALEAADAILADSDSDDDDFTAAYKMVEATVARLKIYTAEELKALVATCKTIYESNNIYNEDLGDLIYEAGSYQNLVDAYDAAEGVVDSASSADITDAYEALDNAKNSLNKLQVVSKSMFRSALKEYEALIAEQYKYESWRLGTIEGWADLSTGNFWAVQGNVMTYGLLMDTMLNLNATINAKYEDLDNIKTLSKTSSEEIVKAYNAAKDAVIIAKAWKVDTVNKSTKSGVKSLLDKYHGNMVYEFKASSAEDLLADIVAVAGADKIQYEAVDPADGSVDLVDYTATPVGAYGYWNVVESLVDTERGWGKPVARVTDAALTIKTGAKLYIPVVDGVYDTSRAIATGTAPADYKSTTYKLVSANTKFDISSLINVAAADVTAAVERDPDTGVELVQTTETGYDDKLPIALADGKKTISSEFAGNAMALTIYPATDVYYNADFDTAYTIATEYLAGTYSGIYAIDDAGVVVDGAKGNAKEWALVYRYLSYAIQDRYEAAAGAKYTKADVKKLIDEAYDYADKTGEAAIFAESHNDVVELRQYAIDWLRKANSNKKYKDYNAGFSSNGDYYESSTTIYNMLNGGADKVNATTGAFIEHLEGLNQLKNEYEAMKYSFGDVYNRIAEVCAMIDDGDLEATDALLTAIDNTAYALSTVSDTIVVTAESWGGDAANYEENAAFSVDRVFQPYNRVITVDSNNAKSIAGLAGFVTAGKSSYVYYKDGMNTSHRALHEAFKALEDEITKQTTPTAKLGDVNGDGVVNALDASMILQANVGIATVDAAVADYDGNGTVNALDASAILIAIVNGTL
ncbi:MAG: dockerin type I repeat-containing protein [Oscillospiraceae bacterium]